MLLKRRIKEFLRVLLSEISYMSRGQERNRFVRYI